MPVLWPESPSQSWEGVWGCWLGLWGERASSLGTWGGGERWRLHIHPQGCVMSHHHVLGEELLQTCGPRPVACMAPSIKEWKQRWWVLWTTENMVQRSLQHAGVCCGWRTSEGRQARPVEWPESARMDPQPSREWKCLLDKLIYQNTRTTSGRNLSTWAKFHDLFHDLVAGKMLWSTRKVAEFSCSKARFQVRCSSITLSTYFSVRNLLWVKTKPHAIYCELGLTFRSPNRFSKERFCCNISSLKFSFIFWFEQVLVSGIRNIWMVVSWFSLMKQGILAVKKRNLVVLSSGRACLMINRS